MVLILHIFVTHLTASTQRHAITISNGGESDGLSYGNLYKKSNKTSKPYIWKHLSQYSISIILIQLWDIRTESFIPILYNTGYSI